MPQTPAGWTGNTLQAVTNLLKNSSNFRTLMGAADAAAADARIIWQDARGAPTTPYATVIVKSLAESEPGLQTVAHAAVVAIYLVWPEITVTDPSQRDLVLLQTNPFDGMMADIRNAIGTGTTYPQRAVRDIEPPERCPDNHATLAGCWDATITLSWTI